MSFSELFFVMVLGLILFGPEELPKVARTIGRMVFEIKKATQDVQNEMHKSIYDVKSAPTQQDGQIKSQATESSETNAIVNEQENTGVK